MGVFLRWGVFGMLAVAALVYAYNASKRMAANRQPVAVTSPAPDAETDDTPQDVEVAVAESDAQLDPEPQPGAGLDEMAALPPVCAEELRVAELALKLRRDGEPLDRLLRTDLIAFQSDPQRRARLEQVANQWFEREGRDPNAAVLRGEVLRDCRGANPAR